MVCFDGMFWWHIYHQNRGNQPSKISKTLCMSWSEVRPWHAKYFWESGGVGSLKIPRPLACPGLRSDRGMQNASEKLGQATQNSKAPCMSWSEVRPWHAKYFGEIGASNRKFQKPLACPGLRSDRGMQPCVPKSTSKIYGFRIFSEFRTCRYHRPTDICMPRSGLRPWHADMVRPLEIEYLYPWY